MSGGRSDAGPVLQLSPQSIEPLAGSVLPPVRLLMAVEEGPVLGEDQSGRNAVRGEFDRRERHGHHVLLYGEGRGIGDSLADHDVVVARLEGQDLTVLVVAS